MWLYAKLILLCFCVTLTQKQSRMAFLTTASSLFLHSSENTLVSNWTWQWAYPLSRCHKRLDKYWRNKTVGGLTPVAWGGHSERVMREPSEPKDLNSWLALWFLTVFHRNQMWRWKQYFQSSQREKSKETQWWQILKAWEYHKDARSLICHL